MFYIYRIKNIINNRVYIGRTENHRKRFVGHQSKLRTNSHPNKDMQKDYSEFGNDIFEYEILDKSECYDTILELEEYYIDLNKNNKYNIMGGGKKGLPREIHPMLGKTHSDETREKISNSIKGKMSGELNGFYGKEHTIETKKTISNSRVGKAIGAENGFSKKVYVYGNVYDTVKEGIEASGFTRYTFYKKIKDKKYNDIRYIE